MKYIVGEAIVGFPNQVTYHDRRKQKMSLMEAIEYCLRTLQEGKLFRVQRMAGASNNIDVCAYRLILKGSKKKKIRVDITYEEKK